MTKFQLLFVSITLVSFNTFASDVRLPEMNKVQQKILSLVNPCQPNEERKDLSLATINDEPLERDLAIASSSTCESSGPVLLYGPLPGTMMSDIRLVESRKLEELTLPEIQKYFYQANSSKPHFIAQIKSGETYVMKIVGTKVRGYMAFKVNSVGSFSAEIEYIVRYYSVTTGDVLTAPGSPSLEDYLQDIL